MRLAKKEIEKLEREGEREGEREREREREREGERMPVYTQDC